MTVGRVDAAAAPLADGRVLVVGGTDAVQLTVSAVLQSAEIYDPASGTFALTGDMTVPRTDAAAAPLPDGRILVAGGRDVNQFPDEQLKSAEIFDPATGTFAPTGVMTAARSGPVAAPLPDGRVLVAGGNYFDGGLNRQRDLQSAEIFDPATGTFAPTGDMTVARDGPAATPLPDGRVLVAGGVYLPSAEIFDSNTGTFAPTGSMAVARVGAAAAAPLPDGRALVAGGGDPYGYSAEVFDPATGTFAPTGYMTTGRYGAAAAPLSDGRVLVAGTNVGFGSGALDATRSAELFTPDLSYQLAGKRLTVKVAVPGTLSVVQAKRRPRASARRGKPLPSLEPARRNGGPRPISVKLTPVGKAARTLDRTGKLKVRVKLRFIPKRVKGHCVTRFSPCYSTSYAIRETRTLRLKVKERTGSGRGRGRL